MSLDHVATGWFKERDSGGPWCIAVTQPLMMVMAKGGYLFKEKLDWQGRFEMGWNWFIDDF